MKILVTGATGYIGSNLVKRLIAKGHVVNILSTRQHASMTGTSAFYWKPEYYEMDEAALDGVEAIIHLAGATLNKRWSTRYKQEIYDSRTRTAETLFKALAKRDNHIVKTFIASSAVGYYPSSLEKTYYENDAPSNDFLGQVCQHWEAASLKMEQLGIRVVLMRTGVVLGRGQGILGRLELPTKLGLAAPLGAGKQWISWIHIEDLCRLYLFALEHVEVNGALNAGGPEPVTNLEFTKTYAQVLNRPCFLPGVPKFALKLALGEMSVVAFMSQKVSPSKTLDLGFTYSHKTLLEALNDLYEKPSNKP